MDRNSQFTKSCLPVSLGDGEGPAAAGPRPHVFSSGSRYEKANAAGCDMEQGRPFGVVISRFPR